MKSLSLFLSIASIISLLILTGCVSAPKPPVALISLNVQPNINPYLTADMKEPEARPVVIRLYELTSLDAFKSKDFISVFYDYKTALEGVLLNSEEFSLAPGTKQKFNRPLHMDTRYVGVVAAFKDIEHSEWSATTTIPSKESAPEIYIFLDRNKILVGAKRECAFFCQLSSPKPPAGTLYEAIE